MKTIGNILWLIFGGIILAALWFIVGLLWCISIIGIPVGVQCFKFAGLCLWPFGKEIVYGVGLGSTIVNIIWIIFFGWELALACAIVGLVFCVTIVGIPFGLQCFKIARLALMPFGAQIVPTRF